MLLDHSCSSKARTGVHRYHDDFTDRDELYARSTSATKRGGDEITATESYESLRLTAVIEQGIGD